MDKEILVLKEMLEIGEYGDTVFTSEDIKALTSAIQALKALKEAADELPEAKDEVSSKDFLPSHPDEDNWFIENKKVSKIEYLKAWENESLRILGNKHWNAYRTLALPIVGRIIHDWKKRVEELKKELEFRSKAIGIWGDRYYKLKKDYDENEEEMQGTILSHLAMIEKYKKENEELRKAMAEKIYEQLDSAAWTQLKKLEARLAEIEKRTRPDGDMADKAVNDFISKSILEGEK